MDEYYSVVQQMPQPYGQVLAALPSWQASVVQEIRLRADNGLYFTVNGITQKANQYCAALHQLNELHPDRNALWDILVSLCGHSLHTYEQQLQQGYFTLPGGHRVGVGGRYSKGTDGYALQCVYSLNIRIARSHIVPLPHQMTHMLGSSFGGMAVIGPPLSGKTTVLRSIARHLGQIGRSCCVIDERDELYISNHSKPSFDGIDIIAGMSKADGALTALRTLSPQVILLDELGEIQEVAALRQAMFSGVDFIVTLHAENLADAERKPQFRALQSINALQCACILTGRSKPGVIAEMRCL